MIPFHFYVSHPYILLSVNFSIFFFFLLFCVIISAIFCIAGISFFVAAGKPGLGFGLSVAGGVTNIVQDYVLIAVIPLGGCRRCLCHSSRLYSASCHRDYVFHYKSKRCALFGAPEVSWESTGQSQSPICLHLAFSQH